MKNIRAVLTVSFSLLVLVLAYILIHNSNYLWFVGQFQEIPEKFWLHRVNSPLKMKEFIEKYRGFEMDVIYNEEAGTFNNSHDAEDGFVFLKDTLAQYKSNKGIWFDIKNLTKTNSSNAEACLSRLIADSGVNKKDAIVESHCLPCLNIFASKGWKTAYYILNEQEPLPLQSQENLKNQLTMAQNSVCDYLSMDGHVYNFIKQNDLLRNKKYLVWYHWEPWYKVNNREEYRDSVNDHNVEIVLVKDRGSYHR